METLFVKRINQGYVKIGRKQKSENVRKGIIKRVHS